MKEGLTVDEAMASVNRSFWNERKRDVAAMHEKEALLYKCGCKSCLGIYAVAVRKFCDKWKMPVRNSEVTPIKSE